LVQLNRLPGCIAAIPAMEKELKDYKTIANAEMEKEPATRRPLWPFWVFNMLQIPSWFAGAEYAALIQPSSACSERVFAMMASLFQSESSSVLEDRKEASVMINMNENWREAERNQLMEVAVIEGEEDD
jgi:hypothetical protein